nr:uncharacterized protein LOC109177999 [Ipomoea trifida]
MKSACAEEVGKEPACVEGADMEPVDLSSSKSFTFFDSPSSKSVVPSLLGFYILSYVFTLSDKLLFSLHYLSIGLLHLLICCILPTSFADKVISKVLSLRLSSVLPSIIDKAQAAFVEGRVMSDNIFLAQELIRGYARKRISLRCMLMVDLRKTYDTISWDFIEEVLTDLQFPQQFIHWILQCITTTSFSISINGGLYGNFKGKSGIRQVCWWDCVFESFVFPLEFFCFFKFDMVALWCLVLDFAGLCLVDSLLSRFLAANISVPWFAAAS